MTIIKSELLVTQANILLAIIKRQTIAYVANGMSLTGMDCQGMVEWLLMQAGIPKAECNLAGSNAHYRACVWVGTPEECKKLFGEIPAGAALFILEQDGNEPDKYKADGIGNASHMGLWTGKTSMAASASKGKVIESNFKGKTINGGWNRVGLLPWVDYGLPLTAEQAAPADALASESTTAMTDADLQIPAPAAPAKWRPLYSKMTFALGSLGNGTREIQRGLNRLGYGLNVDGEFGPLTDAAVRKFQTANGLEVDGIVGPITWAALIKAVNALTQKEG